MQQLCLAYTNISWMPGVLSEGVTLELQLLPTNNHPELIVFVLLQ